MVPNFLLFYSIDGIFEKNKTENNYYSCKFFLAYRATQSFSIMRLTCYG